MPIQKTQEIRGQFRRYRGALLWIARETFGLYRWRVIAILLFGTLATLMQGAVLGLVLVYAHRLEKGGSFHVSGVAIPARDTRALAAVGVAAVALLLLGSLVRYLSQRQTVALVIRYYRRCAERVFTTTARPGEGPILGDFDALTAHRSLSLNDSRFCGRVVRTIVNACTPAITILWAVGFLVWLYWPATLILLVLGLASIGLYYVANRIAVVNQRTLVSSGAGAKAEWVRGAKRLSGVSRWTDHHGQAVGGMLGSGTIRTMFEAYRQRLLGKVNTELVGNALLAVGMGAMLIYMGDRALHDAISWSTLVVYLITVRVALSATRAMFNGLVGFTRMYPYVSRYRAFLDRQVEEGADGPAAFRLNVRGESPFAGSRRRWDAGPGTRAELVAPFGLSRFTVWWFIETICGPAAVRAGGCPAFAFAVMPGERAPGDAPPTPEDLIGPGTTEWRALTEEAGVGDGVAARLEAAFSAADHADDAPAGAWAELALLAAALRHAPVLLIDASLMEALGERAASWRPVFERSAVFVHVGERVKKLGEWGAEIVCVAAGSGLVGLLDPASALERQAEIRDLLAAEREQAMSAARGGYLGEDDDDDDD